MSYRVHVYQPFDDDWLSLFGGKLSPDIALSSGDDVPGDCRVLIAGRPARETLVACRDLEALVIPWAGLPAVTRELMLEFPDIPVYNIHHNALPTAEQAIALMLAAARYVIPIDRQFRKNDWTYQYRQELPILLHGRTAVIVGYGAIGRHLAAVCRGLGMTVLGVKRDVTAAEWDVGEIFPLADLDGLLPHADVLFISLPHTVETDGLFDAEKLARLPDNAIVVNIARGPIIDEAALYAELVSGRLRAGLDVWYNYPKKRREATDAPPADHDFAALDNVVMTPHVGGNADRTEALRMTALAELLNQLADGAAPRSRVDIQRGY